MKNVILCFSTAVLFTATSLAQTSVESQSNASVSQSSSVSAGRSGAQVQSEASGEAATQGALSSHNGSSSAQAGAAGQLASGTSMHARLEKPVDARKCKPGDQVVAKTTENIRQNGEVVIPKGSRIVGHVTQVQARSKQQAQSQVGIAFDHAVLKDGHEVPMNASIQALAASQQAASADVMGDSMADGTVAGGAVMGSGRAAAGAGGSLVGGATRAVGTTSGTLVNTAAHTTGSLGSAINGSTGAALDASGRLTSTSHGVVGLNGLSLAGAAENSTQASVISSTTGNVHLDSGTQMLLRVTGK